MRTPIAVLLLVLCSVAASASTASDRVTEILSMFTKSKNVQKQKRGVTKSVFIEKHGEAFTGTDVNGAYAVDGLELTLDLRGNAGTGTDRHGAFTLRDLRHDGALLTATKVYANGRTSKLEGAFMTLITRAGKTAADATTTRTFGLGVVLDEPYVLDGGVQLERVFYERR
jgi:hypothetical protein